MLNRYFYLFLVIKSANEGSKQNDSYYNDKKYLNIEGKDNYKEKEDDEAEALKVMNDTLKVENEKDEQVKEEEEDEEIEEKDDKEEQ
jgi:hypothetical protein